MPTFARYFDLVREMKNAYNHRLRLVESAKQRGIKRTARLLATTVRTVRKWRPGGCSLLSIFLGCPVAG